MTDRIALGAWSTAPVQVGTCDRPFLVPSQYYIVLRFEDSLTLPANKRVGTRAGRGLIGSTAKLLLSFPARNAVTCSHGYR